MVKNVLRSRWILLALAMTLVVPAVFADVFLPGAPCLAERSTYYSDASKTTVVGVAEFICYVGYRQTGQVTSHWTYENLGPCCSNCLPWGVCGIEP